METEKVILFEIYKKNGMIKTNITDDSLSYELYGFLKCYMKNLEEELKDNIKPIN